MSSIMITEDENFADEKDAFAVIKSENVVTVPGLGFTETVIIDQHFIRRKRHNRLISLVIENPKKIGIGIDESTAAVFYPGQTLEDYLRCFRCGCEDGSGPECREESIFKGIIQPK